MQCDPCDEEESENRSGSLGSDVSGFSGLSVESSDVDDAERLAQRIYRKLQTPVNQPLSMANHRAAVATMVALKDIVERSKTSASQTARMALLCAGIECQRRIVLNTEDPVTRMHLQTTVPLLFALVVMSEGADFASDASSFASQSNAGDQSDAGSVAGSVARSHRSAQSVPRSEAAQSEAARSSPDSEMSEAHLSSPASIEKRRIAAWNALSLDKELISCNTPEYVSIESICRIIMRESKLNGKSWDIDDLSDMATIFFQCSARTMTYKLLIEEPSREKRQRSEGFLTLDTVGMMSLPENEKEKMLASIVDAAESEAGQQALRDLILSFTLPRNVVGVRRHVLLSRETNNMATSNFPIILNSAHDCAMCGAEHTWKHDSNEIHKMSALLAGVAIILASKTQHAIRKEDAFAGRVQLPFLETPPPKPGVKRMALIPSSNQWILYTLSSSGKPSVQFRQSGFEGLKQAVLLFTSADRRV